MGWQAFLAMRPPSVTHNDLKPYRRKDGTLGIRKSLRLHELEVAYDARIRAAGVPDTPLGSGGQALAVTVRVCYAARGDGPRPHTVKPDLDNLLKTILDRLEKCGVIVGDAQVCQIDASKAWMDPAGVFVRVDEVCEHGSA